MWQIQNAILNQDLLGEILLRISILLLVIGMEILQPNKMYITENEIVDEQFRQSRRRSLIPTWLLCVLVIGYPLLFFRTPHLIRNPGETDQAILAWSLAMMLNALVTEATKLAFAWPRPDFFLRCFPNGRATGTHCTGNVKEVTDGRKSFPSGHSSFAFCSFGFLSFWLYGALGGSDSIREDYIKLFTCIFPLFVAACIALSRYVDNHHHLQDVIVGSSLGFITSYLCYRYYYTEIL